MTTEQQQNAEATAAKVGALVALYETAKISRAAFSQVFAALVYAGKIRASRIAEIDLWKWSLINWAEPIEPLGIVPDSDVIEQLRTSAETITEPMPEEMPDGLVTFWSGIETRSTRVARDAAEESGRETKQTRMRRAGISAWRWVAQPDACDDCRKRHGHIYRISVNFRDHRQCACDLEPATEAEIEASERNRAAAKQSKTAKRKQQPLAPKTDEAKLAELRARLRAAKVHKDEIDVRNLEKLIAALENK